MRLCDTDIERYLDDGIISLTPRPDNDKINGATIDVRLGNSFRVFREHSAPYIDLSGPKEEVSAQLESVMSDEIIISDDEAFFLHPGMLALATISGYKLYFLFKMFTIYSCCQNCFPVINEYLNG